VLPQINNSDLNQFLRPELTLAEALRERDDDDDEGERGTELERAVRETRQAENGNGGDKALLAFLKEIIAEGNAPLTPDQLATEAYRRRPQLFSGLTANQRVVKVRRLLTQAGLSAGGGAVKAGEAGDRRQPGPQEADPALLSLNAALARGPMSDARGTQVADMLLDPKHRDPAVSATLSLEEQRQDAVVSEIAPPTDFLPKPPEDHGEPWTQEERQELERLLRRANKLVRRLKPGRERIMLIRLIGDATRELESTAPGGMGGSKSLLKDMEAAVSAGQFTRGT
jgi:hypothetical protein